MTTCSDRRTVCGAGFGLRADSSRNRSRCFGALWSRGSAVSWAVMLRLKRSPTAGSTGIGSRTWTTLVGISIELATGGLVGSAGVGCRSGFPPRPGSGDSSFEPGLGPALAGLSRRQRQAVVFVAGCGTTHSDTAALMGLSRSSVHTTFKPPLTSSDSSPQAADAVPSLPQTLQGSRPMFDVTAATEKTHRHDESNREKGTQHNPWLWVPNSPRLCGHRL